MTFLRKHAAVLLWWVVVTILSIMPGISLPEFDLLSPDKLAHAFIYFVLSVLILRSYQKAENTTISSGMLWWTFSASTGYGVLMEWVQGTFLQGRFCEFDDMIANAFGAACGVMYFHFRIKRS